MDRGWKRCAFAALVLALGVRIGYVFAEPLGGPSGDGLHYLTLARYLASTGHWQPQTVSVLVLLHSHGHAYTHASLLVSPDAYWPPAFIFMLAGLMRVYWLFVNLGAHEAVTSGMIVWLRVAQQLLGTVTVALIGLIALRLFGRRVALIALVLAAVFPPLVSLPQSMDSETLFIPLVLGSVLATLAYTRGRRTSNLILASALVALAALTRAEGLILVPVLILVAWRHRSPSPSPSPSTAGGRPGPSTAGGRPGPSRRTGSGRLSVRSLAPVAVVVCSCAVVFAPWTIRNYVEFHHVVPTMALSGGNTLAGVYNAAAASMRQPGWVSPRGDPALWSAYYGNGTDEWAQNAKLESAAFTYAEGHPAYVAKVVYWNLRRLLNIESPAAATGPNAGLPQPIVTAGVICSWVLELLALIGAFTAAARRAPWWIWLFPGAIVAAIVAVTIDYQRFQFPIDPFLMLLAALAIDRIVGRRPGRRRELRTDDRARRRPRDSEYRLRSGEQPSLTPASA